MRILLIVALLALSACRQGSDSVSPLAITTTPITDSTPITSTKPIDPFDLDSLDGVYTVAGATNYTLTIQNHRASFTWLGFGPSLNSGVGANNLYFSYNSGSVLLERTQDDRSTYGTISLIGTIDSKTLGTGNHNTSGRMSNNVGQADYINIYSYTSNCITVGGVLTKDTDIVYVGTYMTYTALLSFQSNRITYCRQ